MFRVGDKVAHPMHGAGVIDEIVTETVAGAAQDYYVFRMPVGGLTLKIPTASGETFGLRGIWDLKHTSGVSTYIYSENPETAYIYGYDTLGWWRDVVGPHLI